MPVYRGVWAGRIFLGTALLGALGVWAAESPGPAMPSNPPAAGAVTESVRIATGLITGVEKNGVRRYLGIPFAAPPVGDLRWKPPQPAPSWDGVRACAKFGPSCPQPKSFFGGVSGPFSEDCLYLNVWTAAKQADEKRPVMVWIHGGGCTTGSGSQAWYDGEALARQGVVLVTINYRLGPFGFLAHPLLSKESPRGVSGNYGMLDQVAALGWVQKNIAALGGDPGCVTIFGESAGGMSVSDLMASPLAKGLFHRAIAESGGCVGHRYRLKEPWRGSEPMEKIGEQIAATLGCDKAADPLAALRAKTPDELLAAASPSVGLFGKGIKFGPVVDGWFLPDDPAAIWASGRQHDVPFLTGSNADDGSIFTAALGIRQPEDYERTARQFYGPRADEVLALFPAKTAEEIKPALNRMTTIAAFVMPARFMARAMARTPSKAYLYHFTRVSTGGRWLKFGAIHAIEIPYVFGNVSRALLFEEKDRTLSEAMVRYWINFARTGDPNGEGLVPWPAHEAASDQYLELGDTIAAKSGLYARECDLLDRLVEERMRLNTRGS